ncbi:MAG: hypothetical protein IT478_07800, partial [Xanthomonadales bacterium]|nr:hypothetical protein [Xanthomonadales bacterium]
MATAATAAETARYRVLPGGEAANKGRDVYSRVDAPTATVNYSDTIAAAPTFNRPAGCGGLSGVGTAVGYHVQQFSVDMSGSYTIEVLGTSTISDGDSYLIIYQTAFDPMTPLTNCMFSDDDSGTGAYSLAT